MSDFCPLCGGKVITEIINRETFPQDPYFSRYLDPPVSIERTKCQQCGAWISMYVNDPCFATGMTEKDFFDLTKRIRDTRKARAE